MIENFLYCPLDLPAVPADITLDNFFSFDTFKGPAADAQNEKHSWRMLTLRRIIDKTTQLPLPGEKFTYDQQLDFNQQWEWKPQVVQHAPNLIRWVEQNVPIEKITLVAILCSRRVIAPHTDVLPHRHKEPINEFYRSWDPSMFRFLLDGDMVPNGFYVMRNGKKIYTELPASSPGWAMSFDCVHGNDDPVPERKLLLYVMGKIDTQRHRELLSRSLEKYGQYAIST